MRTNPFKLLALALCLVFSSIVVSSCSKEENPLDETKGKVNLSGILFKLEEEPFETTEEEVSETKSGMQSETEDTYTETIDLGNNMMADVVISRDKEEPVKRMATRAVSDGTTYTLLAYQNKVFKGSVQVV